MLPTNGTIHSFSIKSLNQISFSDACHDHFRIDKEQSMLADCQQLSERNELLDKPDKYGITLVKENITAIFLLEKERIPSDSLSYILPQLKHTPQSCVFSYNIMLMSIKLTTRELRHCISVLNMNKCVEKKKRTRLEWKEKRHFFRVWLSNFYSTLEQIQQYVIDLVENQVVSFISQKNIRSISALQKCVYQIVLFVLF